VSQAPLVRLAAELNSLDAIPAAAGRAILLVGRALVTPGVDWQSKLEGATVWLAGCLPAFGSSGGAAAERLPTRATDQLPPIASREAAPSR
jgi:hypothetical protein